MPMTTLNGRFAARRIQGARDYQEDDFGLYEIADAERTAGEHILMVLADGMGGHVGGAEASRIAVRAFIENFENLEGSIAERLRAALFSANDAVEQAIQDNGALNGMGCTLVGVSVSPDGVEWVSVGDSPFWLFGANGLRQLNADHSMAPVLWSMVESGDLTEEEALNDPKRNALRSAITGEEIHLIDQSAEPVVLRAGDRLLLASDGLQTLSDKQISKILKLLRNRTVDETVRALITAVEDRKKPRQDNTTALLYEPKIDPNVSGKRKIRPILMTDVNRRKSRPGWLPVVAISSLLLAFVAIACKHFIFTPKPVPAPYQSSDDNLKPNHTKPEPGSPDTEPVLPLQESEADDTAGEDEQHIVEEPQVFPVPPPLPSDNKDAWKRANKLDKIAVYQVFLDNYPKSEFAAKATARMEELISARRKAAIRVLSRYEHFDEDFDPLVARYIKYFSPLDELGDERTWEMVRSADRPQDYQWYIDNYPNGEHVKMARQHLSNDVQK